MVIVFYVCYIVLYCVTLCCAVSVILCHVVSCCVILSNVVSCCVSCVILSQVVLVVSCCVSCVMLC